MFTLHINTENPAFSPATENEVARILRELAERLEFAGAKHSGSLQDSNRKTVGRFDLNESEWYAKTTAASGQRPAASKRPADGQQVDGQLIGETFQNLIVQPNSRAIFE